MALESRRRSGLKPWNGPLCAQIFGSSHCCHLRACLVGWLRFAATVLGVLPAMRIGEVLEMSYTSRSCGLSIRSRFAHGIVDRARATTSCINDSRRWGVTIAEWVGLVSVQWSPLDIGRPFQIEDVSCRRGIWWIAFVAWLFRLRVLRNGGIERVGRRGPVNRTVRRRDCLLYPSDAA